MKKTINKRFQVKSKTNHDEFYFYLSANTPATQKDRSPLFRGKDLTKKYSTLTEMTTNVLAIPITNVDIKKAFNLTHQVVDVNRARLLSEIIKQIMMLKCSPSIVSFEKKKSTFEFKQCSSKKRELAAQIKINKQDKIINITLSMFTMKDVENEKNMNDIIENDFNGNCGKFLKKC